MGKGLNASNVTGAARMITRAPVAMGGVPQTHVPATLTLELGAHIRVLFSAEKGKCTTTGPSKKLHSSALEMWNKAMPTESSAQLGLVSHQRSSAL